MAKAPTSESRKRMPIVILSHISGSYVFAIEYEHGSQQETKDVSAARCCVVIKIVPRYFRLQHVTPKIHVGCKEKRPQVYEELNPPDDVEHQINRERCGHGSDRVVENCRQQQRDCGHHQERPGA